MKAFLAGLPPTGESALFRALHPTNWWWTPDTDFAAAILYALQVSNWQRGGGKGPKPKPVSKPRDKGKIPTLVEFEAKKRKLKDDRERHRRRKAVSGGD